jgi:hypothetical protein
LIRSFSGRRIRSSIPPPLLGSNVYAELTLRLLNRPPITYGFYT